MEIETHFCHLPFAVPGGDRRQCRAVEVRERGRGRWRSTPLSKPGTNVPADIFYARKMDKLCLVLNKCLHKRGLRGRGFPAPIDWKTSVICLCIHCRKRGTVSRYGRASDDDDDYDDGDGVG